MRSRFAVISVASAACTIASAVWAVAPPAPWTPDATIVQRLAPVVTTGPYQIQPPQRYVLQTRPGPSGSISQAWVGPAREDGTRCYIMLVTMTPPADGTTTYTLDQVAAKMLAGIQKRRTDWKQTTPETGTVNGMTFVRTYWRGKEATSGVPMYGFSYVAQDGKGFVQLSSQDVEAYWKDTMPSAEASVLTFRKTETAGGKATETAPPPASGTP